MRTVADLPVEESGELHAALGAMGLGLIPLVAPTSPPERIRTMAALEPPWIYCVALVGVTGARQDLAERIIADALPVRFQVQLHKIIWPPEQRGV